MEENNQKIESISGRALLIYLSIRYGGDWGNIYQAIKAKEKVDLVNAASIVESSNHQCLTLLDEDYPKLCKEGFKPPFVLFYKGNKNLLDEIEANSLGIFNGSVSTAYAKNAITELTVKVSSKAKIVIPLVDKWSYELASAVIKSGGVVIGILPKGIDGPFEEEAVITEIIEKGLLISEFPGNTKDKQKNRIQQSRLVAILTSNVLVGAVTKKETQMTGIGASVSLGSNVFCLPFNLGSQYISNELIYEGATLVIDENTILNDGTFRKE